MCAAKANSDLFLPFFFELLGCVSTHLCTHLCLYIHIFYEPGCAKTLFAKRNMLFCVCPPALANANRFFMSIKHQYTLW